MKEELKRVEDILYSYPVRKIEIKNIKLELENMELSSTKYDIEIKEDLKRKLKIKENEVQKIENTIDILDKRDKDLLEMKFFKNYSNTKIAFELYTDSYYVSQLKAKIIKKIAPMLLV